MAHCQGHGGAVPLCMDTGEVMSDSSQGPGWWEASDGKWYPAEQHPDYRMPSANPSPATYPSAAQAPSGAIPPIGMSAPPLQSPASPPMGYPFVPQNQKTNGLAIASLVLGIVWVGGVGALLAIIFGFIGRKKIAESNGQQTGGGLALAGIILGFIGILGAIGFWLSIFALGAAGSYASGFTYGSDNYSAGGSEAAVCNSSNVPSGDISSSWISGCQAAWNGQVGTGSSSGNTGNTGSSSSTGTSGNTGNSGASVNTGTSGNTGNTGT